MLKTCHAQNVAAHTEQNVTTAHNGGKNQKELLELRTEH